MKFNKVTVVFAIIILLGACVTVNIYFPAAEIKKAADKIVDDIRGKTLEDVPKEQSQLWDLFVKPAFAAMDIDVSNPAIREHQKLLKERFPSLVSLYNEGKIGEANTGFVEIRDIEGLGLKEKKLINEENNNRQTLYKEILDANKLGAENLGEVQRIFANSWRDNAPKGWWIQKDDGAWSKKE
ncbi:MAG: DUF1318 domain-containing protein [bacterium]